MALYVLGPVTLGGAKGPQGLEPLITSVCTERKGYALRKCMALPRCYILYLIGQRIVYKPKYTIMASWQNKQKYFTFSNTA